MLIGEYHRLISSPLTVIIISTLNQLRYWKVGAVMVAKEESNNLLSCQEVTIATQAPYSLRNQCVSPTTQIWEGGDNQKAYQQPLVRRVIESHLPCPTLPPPPPIHTGNKSLFDGLKLSYSIPFLVQFRWLISQMLVGKRTCPVEDKVSFV